MAQLMNTRLVIRIHIPFVRSRKHGVWKKKRDCIYPWNLKPIIFDVLFLILPFRKDYPSFQQLNSEMYQL